MFWFGSFRRRVLFSGEGSEDFPARGYNEAVQVAAGVANETERKNQPLTGENQFRIGKGKAWENAKRGRERQARNFEDRR